MSTITESAAAYAVRLFLQKCFFYSVSSVPQRTVHRVEECGVGSVAASDGRQKGFRAIAAKCPKNGP